MPFYINLSLIIQLPQEYIHHQRYLIENTENSVCVAMEDNNKKTAESDVAGGEDSEDVELNKFLDLIRRFRDSRDRLRDRQRNKTTPESYDFLADNGSGRSKRRKTESEEEFSSDPNKRHVHDCRLNLNLTL